MTDLEKYEAVNACETLGSLAQVILSFADEDGMIQGRTKKFNAELMAHSAKNYNVLVRTHQANVLTREFGIRQQAMYITHYM